MRECLAESGTVSIRAQLGIAQDDPRVFRPFEYVEIARVAKLLQSDSQIPSPVRRMLRLGLMLDLRPAALGASRSALARRLGVADETVRRQSIAWECVEPVLRADIAHRASRAIFAWRAKSTG